MRQRQTLFLVCCPPPTGDRDDGAATLVQCGCVGSDDPVQRAAGLQQQHGRLCRVPCGTEHTQSPASTNGSPHGLRDVER